MKSKFLRRLKLFVTSNAQANDPNQECLDLREEYAKAFRTESYNDFWTTVLALNKGNLVTHRSVGSSTSARLPSYRLFAEHLLDPDQPTVTRILASTQTRPEILILLKDYFSNSCEASHVCGLLLKDIDHIRKRSIFLKDPFSKNGSPPKASNGSAQSPADSPETLSRAALFWRSKPFSPSAPSMSRFQAMQSSSSSLLGRLEARRDKIEAKISRLKKLKCGSAVVIAALTASLVVMVAAHAFVALVAAPGVAAASIGTFDVGKLSRWSVQLDAAAKGTYILIRDLDTISRLVARVNSEMEHVEALMKVWMKRDDRLQAGGEVASRLRKIDERFIEQVDELEEHLYLCIMTINRARNIVLKQILNSSNELAI
ncbi:UPF0496 protein At3g49070 isoform X2 [Andrographis paniculata]|nr:UPF0496 protein At3g49070 isoform X2 [Andrographis paniculata]